MSIPVHTLNIYQKPKLGNLFVARYPMLNYRHQIVANGWYDTASCDLTMSRVQAENAFENWIGNRVAAYVDNPAQPIWEGLITRVTYSIGGATFTRSIDSMFNQVRGMYRAYVTASTPLVTTAQNDLSSQSIYGVKHGTFDGFYEYNSQANLVTRMNAARAAIINNVGWPQTSVTVGGGGQAIISLEMQGFYHTLEWEEYYYIASTAGRTITNYIIGVLSGLANATTFFNNADYTGIQANVAYTNLQEFDDSAQPAWQSLMKIAGAGDGTTFWIVGITPTNFVTGTRRLYYRSINTAVEYIAYGWDNLRVRNQWGGLIKPWNVVPDRTIRINDALVGWAAAGDDPRETYINRVQYDAEQQRVTWSGGDDLTMEGTMQLQQYYKMYNSRFGAPLQSNWA